MSESTSKNISNAFWFIEAIILAFAIESFATQLTREVVPTLEISEELIFLLVFLLISVMMSIEVYYAPEYAQDRSLGGEISSHICLIFSVLSLVIISEAHQADQTATELINSVSIALIFLFLMFLFIRLLDEATVCVIEGRKTKIFGRNIQYKSFILTILYTMLIIFYFGIFLSNLSGTYVFVLAVSCSFSFYYIIAYFVLPSKILIN